MGSISGFERVYMGSISGFEGVYMRFIWGFCSEWGGLEI